MTPMMKRLCDAAKSACANVDPHRSLEERQAEAVVRTVLFELIAADRPTLEAVGNFNADFSFDNGRDPPFSRQLGVAINAIMAR